MPGLDPAATALARFRYVVAANAVLVSGERFRRVLKAGFRPDEPRVPAGNPGGGQWTGGGGGGAAEQGIDPIVTGSSPVGDPRRYSVDLREEEAPACIGHTIGKHVGKTDAELVQTLKKNTHRGWFVDVVDAREGSFRSVEEANDFTNRVLQMNKGIVDMVASGKMDEKFLEERFGHVPGARPDGRALSRMPRLTSAVHLAWAS